MDTMVFTLFVLVDAVPQMEQERQPQQQNENIPFSLGFLFLSSSSSRSTNTGLVTSPSSSSWSKNPGLLPTAAKPLRLRMMLAAANGQVGPASSFPLF
jgi:hypothetical protein